MSSSDEDIDWSRMDAHYLNKAEESYEKRLNYPRLVKRGKVRDVYQIADDELMIETTDRVSAFDRHIGNVPGKGKLLQEITTLWFENLDVHHNCNQTSIVLIIY